MMKALLMQLLLPPIIVAVPWLVPAARKQWARCVLIFLIWCAAIALMLLKWAGPGAMLLVGIGLLTTMTTVIQIE